MKAFYIKFEQNADAQFALLNDWLSDNCSGYSVTEVTTGQDTEVTTAEAVAA